MTSLSETIIFSRDSWFNIYDTSGIHSKSMKPEIVSVKQAIASENVSKIDNSVKDTVSKALRITVS